MEQNREVSGEILVTGAEDRFGNPIRVYDDGFGGLWGLFDSLGMVGIVRASTWEIAYEIFEQEFMHEAQATIEELVAEYGFRREHRKVIRADASIPECIRPACLGAGEKFAEPEDYSDNGKLPEGRFIRWETIDTRDPDAWVENECFLEGYGFRPSGPNDRDKYGNGIFVRDCNGERVWPLNRAWRKAEGIRIHARRWSA